ncbi:MAG: hypothetical protein IKL55_04120 [Clostridia bacterium]|nr:hypothetical protein [Clostridia bacterium]
MNNEIDEKNELDDSASIEIKEGFFSKLFNSFGRKALPPANGTVKTNASMSSLMARGSLRAALINIGNKIQNVFTPPKETTPTNTLSAHVIGETKKEDVSIDKTKTDDENILSAEQPRVYIPTPKSTAVNRRTTVLNNNSNISVEEINVDSDVVSKESNLENDSTISVDKEQKNQPAIPDLQAVDITINNKNQNSKNEKSTDEHEQTR